MRFILSLSGILCSLYFNAQRPAAVSYIDSLVSSIDSAKNTERSISCWWDRNAKPGKPFARSIEYVFDTSLFYSGNKKLYRVVEDVINSNGTNVRYYYYQANSLIKFREKQSDTISGKPVFKNRTLYFFDNKFIYGDAEDSGGSENYKMILKSSGKHVREFMKKF